MNKIKRFTINHLKKGENLFIVAKKAEKIYGGSFKIVDGNLYQETPEELKIIADKGSIKKHENI